MNMPVKGQNAATKAKRRDGSDDRAALDRDLARGEIDRRELRARILADLAIPGGPSEKY